jgi:hypothetical protein
MVEFSVARILFDWCFFLRILHLIWKQRWATTGVYPVLSLRQDYDAVRLRPLEL